MKKLTILCSLVLALGFIPSAHACGCKKKIKRETLEPVREYRAREDVSFRPYTRTERDYRPATRRAYWVPGHVSTYNGCWINSSWRY